MQPIASFVGRLSSRKFILTLFGLFLITAFPQYSDHIVTLIGVFIGAEGIGDAAQRLGFGSAGTAAVIPSTTTLPSTGTVDNLTDLQVVPGDVPL